MYEQSFPNKRFKKTLEFLENAVAPPAKVLDLGVANPFSKIMKDHNYDVTNTLGEDLDVDTNAVKSNEYDLVTAFEIFEHLIAPYNVLKDIKASKLVATVPLNLWFANAYRSKTDMRDRHYHEFEDWQFDWLLEKAGWKIKKTEKWTNPVKQLGFRPLLRTFTPRYYAVYAER
ncbi:class I SAM-dependent methyltransferase [Gillisia sp. M10.2A]|uniref:Class I SAM-dependent methyltransferase n=1 Tax=Gillisia lutea TaxID=2909668 RepID=A0ABS9EH80_9FLAO|nr:class I SAM-dependent methyltransferase [Gillisia lutea]MCF4102233.1 class I SAM-dependent methyltransferase [Gillisia lutea]